MNYTSAPVASRELQIPLALDQLEESIQRLGKVSEELTMKLEKVCAPGTNVQEAKTPIPNPPTAEYVDNLRKKAEKILRVCEMLENILQRIEL